MKRLINQFQSEYYGPGRPSPGSTPMPNV